MSREKTPINNILDLLEALYVDRLFGRKIKAILHSDKTVGSENFFVEEYFDDGHGHSNAVTSKETPVTKEVFEQAKKGYFVSGVLKPGYVSETEFVLTKFGMESYFRLSAEKKVSENVKSVSRNTI